MTPRCYKRKTAAALRAEISRRWTGDIGLIVILKTSAKDEEAGRIAVAPSNESLLPESCIVWKGEENVYQGPLDTALDAVLVSLRFCRAEFTDFRSSEARTPSDRVCMADNCTDCKLCKAGRLC